MEKLIFDNGMRKFQINGDAVLEFNPSDMNLYSRFQNAAEKIVKIETELVQKGANCTDVKSVLQLMAEADAKVKEVLKDIFGAHNDFEVIFGGVNVMSIATNGERVITNFIAAITPIIESGVKQYAKAKAAAVAGGAKMNRAQRRAQK